MSSVNRNGPCPCGSGKKFKHCCGSLTGGAQANAMGNSMLDKPAFDLAEEKKHALELQLKGVLPKAADRYRNILLHAPSDFDALHMLGVIQGQMSRPVEAMRYLLDASAVGAGDYPPFYDNVGRCLLAICSMMGGFDLVVRPDLIGSDAPFRVFQADIPQLSCELPLVSVVVPCFNHERYVAEALRSVFAQHYANIELIIIDDGSRDASIEQIKSVLSESPFETKWIARENRGAHMTINEGIQLARGKYIGILNSDDRYLPHRIACMVGMLEAHGKHWGFSGVRFIDAEGEEIGYGKKKTVDIYMAGLDRLYSPESITVGFADFNFSISTGNLFFSKELAMRLGGFRDYRYVHDWDFCLRALEYDVPAVLHEPAYDYRLHGANTVREGRPKIVQDIENMLVAWGQGEGSEGRVSSKRMDLVALARERAFLSANKGHYLGNQRLLEMAREIYALAKAA